jgi:hypothetical protein
MRTHRVWNGALGPHAKAKSRLENFLTVPTVLLLALVWCLLLIRNLLLYPSSHTPTRKWSFQSKVDHKLSHYFYPLIQIWKNNLMGKIMDVLAAVPFLNDSEAVDKWITPITPRIERCPACPASSQLYGWASYSSQLHSMPPPYKPLLPSQRGMGGSKLTRVLFSAVFVGSPPLETYPSIDTCRSSR